LATDALVGLRPTTTSAPESAQIHGMGVALRTEADYSNFFVLDIVKFASLS